MTSSKVKASLHNITNFDWQQKMSEKTMQHCARQIFHEGNELQLHTSNEKNKTVQYKTVDLYSKVIGIKIIFHVYRKIFKELSKYLNVLRL